MNRRHVAEAQEQVQQALFDYTLNCYAHIPVSVSLFFFFFQRRSYHAGDPHYTLNLLPLSLVSSSRFITTRVFFNIGV